MLVFFIWPVLALLITGLGGEDLSESVAVFRQQRTWLAIWQTIAHATSATALSVILWLPAAFVMYRLRFRGQRFLRGLLTVPFVLPTVVVGTAFVALFGPGGPLVSLGLDRTFTAVVLALTFFNVTL